MDFKDLDFVKKCEIVANFLTKLGKNITAEDWPLKFRLEKLSEDFFRGPNYYIEVNDKSVPPMSRERYLILTNDKGLSCFKYDYKDKLQHLESRTKLFKQSIDEVMNTDSSRENEF